jgi:hypothetical protein
MKKSKLFLFKSALLTLFILLAFSSVRAQVASCSVTMANDIQLDPSHLKVDVYVKSTNDVDFPDGFPYGNGQYKFTFNSAIKNGTNGVIRGKFVSGSTELTNPSQVNSAISQPAAAINYFRIAARVPVPYADASIISNIGLGTRIFSFILISRDTVLHTYVPFSTTQADLTLTIASPGGTSVTYVLPDETVDNCNPQVLINTNVVNPLLNNFPPTAYAVTGGGSYCQGSGGLAVGLANSELGVTYTLYKNTVAQIPTVAGTGSSISFGNQLFGTYTVSGTNTGGTTAMTGSAIITETPTVPVSVSIAPDANNVCAGTSVTFTATPTNGGAPTYQWYKNTLPVATGVTYSYVPVNGDVVYVMMTSDIVCGTPNPATSNSVTMNVFPAGPATVSIVAGANPSCGTASVTFTATPLNGGVPTYQWYVNTLPVGTGLATFSYIPTTGDLVNVVMTSSLPCATGSPATSNTINMTVDVPLPVSVAATTTNPVCAGTSVTFTAAPINGGTPNYQWYKNSLPVATGVTYTYVPVNGDQIYVVMTSSLSCTSGSPATSPTTTMIVNPLPVPTISGPASVCVNSTGNVYNTQAGMTGYVWAITGGTITAGAGTDIVTVTWTSAGVKTLSVNYTNADLCTALTPTVYNVTVNPLPVPTISGLTPAGVGTAQVYTTETGMTNYLWSVSAGGTIIAGGTTTSNTVTVLWNVAGAESVSVNYTNANSCTATASTFYAVSVISIPPAAGVITGTSTVCQGSTGVAYSVALIPNATSYIWTLPTGATIATGANTNSITVNYSYTAVSGNISVYGSNIFGNGAPSPNFPVTVNLAATPTITGPVSACLNSTSNIYTTQAGMTGYAWIVNGGIIVAGAGTNAITVNWNATGAQTVSVNYFNANGCNAATPTVYNVTVNPLPVVTITGPASVCLNSTGNVYTTEVGMTSYVWTVVGGTITAGGGAANNTVSITWTSTGAKTVSVNYNNANGCSAATATVYNVSVNVLPVPTITGPATPCSNVSGIVYSTEAGNTGYAWTTSAGGLITAGAGTNSITVIWNSAGAQSVSVNYINSNGCTAATPTTYNVTVLQSSAPVITGPTEACSGSDTAVYYTQSGQTNYVWAVSAGGTIVAGGTGMTYSVSVVWSVLGPQWVSVNYTSSGGSCMATVPTVLNVNVGIGPEAAGSINGPAIVCAGATEIGYDVAEITGATSYVWTLPVGASIVSGDGTNAITVDFDATAVSGNITVAGNNNCGEGTSSTLAVTVTSLPANAGVVTGPASVCDGATGVAYTVAPIANATTYVWSLPAGATIASGAGTNSITVNFGSESGTITVLGTNACGDGVASPAFAITVNPIPATPVITQVGNTLFSDAPTGNQWYMDGAIIDGATAASYDVTMDGTYYCIVTLNGCSSEPSNSLEVVYDNIINLSSGQFEIFPVPSNGLFTATMMWPNAATFTIRVYNNIGSLVYEMKDVQVNGTTKQTIDMRPIPSGMYTITFTTGTNQIIRKMMINRE